MPHPFPHHYELDLSWLQGENTELTSGPRAPIAGGPPAQFDGKDETRWSPEHLLLAALSQCLLLTFQALNKRSQIPLKSWKCRAESALDKTKEGLVFTSFTLTVNATTDAARVDEAKRLIETAKKYCIIANSLKTPASLAVTVDAA